MPLAPFRFAPFALLALLVTGQTSTVQTKSFPISNRLTPQEFQELQTAVRTMTDIRQLEAEASRTAITASGTPDQLALAQWLITQLDRPASAPPPPDSSASRFNPPDAPGSQVRIFRLQHAGSLRDLQEVMTLIRTMADIRKIFPNNTQHALCMRGTDEEMLLAEWLVQALDQPPATVASPQPAGREFALPGGAEQVRLFFLPRTGNSPELSTAFTAVRSATTARRIFYNTAQHALAVRGTPQELSAAAAALR